jgi:hypothetical protein
VRAGGVRSPNAPRLLTNSSPRNYSLADRLKEKDYATWLEASSRKNWKSRFTVAGEAA